MEEHDLKSLRDEPFHDIVFPVTTLQYQLPWFNHHFHTSGVGRPFLKQCGCKVLGKSLGVYGRRRMSTYI